MDLDYMAVENPSRFGWRSEVARSAHRPGFTRIEYALVPELGDDLFSEPLAELRESLARGIREFRATEFVMVGPTVTCRGETICEPVKVPLDEHTYRVRVLADSWRALKSDIQVMGSHFQQAASLIVDAAKVLDGLIENNDNERK